MILSIQYLRFFACLMVVILHITLKSHINNGGSYIHFGHAGVDIFFAISGFIMCYISEKKDTDTILFLKNRVIRIYPIYIITLIPFIIIFLFMPQIVNTHGQPPSILKSITLIPFFNGSYLNLVAWTLSYEIYFYLIFSISLLLRKHAIFASITTILTLILIGKAFNIEFISSLISVEFIFGMMIYKLIYKKTELNKYISLVIILIGAGVIYTTPSDIALKSDLYRVLYYGIPSAMILTGVLSPSISKFNSKTLTVLGDSSYSIYLTHILTINIVYVAFAYFGMQQKMYLIMVATAVLMSTIIGVAVHLTIEKAVMKKIRSI